MFINFINFINVPRKAEDPTKIDLLHWATLLADGAYLAWVDDKEKK